MTDIATRAEQAKPDDLVQRLRAKYMVTDEFSTIRRPVNPDGYEGAAGGASAAPRS